MLDKCEVIVTRIQVHSVVLALIPEIRFGANTARSVNVRRGARRLGGGRWLSQQRLGRAPTGSRHRARSATREESLWHHRLN